MESVKASTERKRAGNKHACATITMSLYSVHSNKMRAHDCAFDLNKLVRYAMS